MLDLGDLDQRPFQPPQRAKVFVVLKPCLDRREQVAYGCIGRGV
jgi:hypothetical protein